MSAFNETVTKGWSYKVAQIFPKVAQIVETACLTYNDLFLNDPKSHQSFWATFINEFVIVKLQKSPNLVTVEMVDP